MNAERTLIDDAISTLVGGDASLAEEKLREVVAQFPHSLEAHYNLGTLLARSGKRDQESISMFRSILATSPNHLPSLSRLALLLERNGLIEEIISLLKKMIVLDGSDATTHSNLSGLYLMQGQPEQALSSARQAIKLDPSAHRSWFMLGTALEAVHLPSIPAFSHAVKLDPTFAPAFLSLSMALLAAGDGETALAMVNKSLALDAKDEDAVRCRQHIVSLLPLPPMQCLVCTQKSDLKCARCKSAYYCSKECQRKHWSQHKSRCWKD